MTATPPPFALAVADVALAPQPLPDEQILAGSPEVSAKELWRSPDGTVSSGIWEHTPGVSTDVEADEVFVVVSGHATIAFEDDRLVEARAGDVVELRAGERTVWTVHETLRKVYTAVG
jgi:uncharacterized cupin superfamily protein